MTDPASAIEASWDGAQVRVLSASRASPRAARFAPALRSLAPGVGKQSAPSWRLAPVYELTD
jgi:hypothetical protein